MADLESKETGSRNLDVQEMYHGAVNDRSSDERKIEGEGIDAGDMYRMGKDQQFRVSSRQKDENRENLKLICCCSAFSDFRR
jgi:hypothetical protein